ncbi:hypothetical protein K4K61_002617 [Colletotrichum sp. SAR11_59]|uniref:Uncharacterized protein n=1 Tax=Colletotrichum asianum TaxID=702518 RepID=A0A8H3WJJ3_9PEZI|nr:hypothetical protein GQ607_005746 [Colletotrichum asianum]KAI8305516.1 hypothetical protein K4K59_012187 [Colletotrichum sp. SAR11_240]KAI8308457.1 hypothetical protein K4K61_002617 [Colletotrichum sp. SAR11_59]
MSLPFPTNRFGPSFTLGPSATASTEATRTPEATSFPTGSSSNDGPAFPNNILQQSGLTPGQVIGISVGATAGLVFFVVALGWFWNWRRERQLRKRDAALVTAMHNADPEKPEGTMGAAQNAGPGEMLEMPAPRGLHEMPETQQGPAIELPAPVERSELPG